MTRFRKKQPLVLRPRPSRRFIPVDGKVLLDHAVRVSLTGFDLSTQQSCEKRGFSCRGRKPGPSG